MISKYDPPDGLISVRGIVLFQRFVFVRYRLQPFVGGFFAGDLHGQVGEPAVRGRAVPVLDAGGDESRMLNALRGLRIV